MIRKFIILAFLCCLAWAAEAQNTETPPPNYGLVTVTSNVQLEALGSSLLNALRTGITTNGDSQPLFFNASSSSCSVPGGNGTTQIPTSDGKCWVATSITSIPVSPAQGGTGVTSTSAIPVTATGGNTASSLAQRYGHYLNVVDDFGADPTGSVDAATAITAADAAAHTAGIGLYFPGGTYKLGSAVTPSTSAHWFGSSYATAILSSSSTTANTVNLSNSFVTLEQLQFTASVTKSAGAFIASTGTNETLLHIFTNGAFNALTLGASSGQLLIDDFIAENTVAGSGVDFVVNGCTNCQWDHVTLTNASGSRPFAHVNLVNSSDIHCYDCNFLQGSNNLYIAPGTGSAVSEFKMFGGYLDEAGSNNVVIVPSGTGTVGKIEFFGTWFEIASASTVDLDIAPSGTATVDTVLCSSCEMYAASASGTYGVAIAQASGTTATNIKLLGGCIAGVGIGVNVASAGAVELGDLTIGKCGQINTAVNTSVNLTGTITTVIAHDLNQLGSTTELQNTATVTNSSIHNNL
jgi:hypothetical protein